ncbi:hypothetical protein D3C80_1475190 [compost metagenome]
MQALSHRSQAKRSSIGTRVIPAKCFANSSCSPRSTLMHRWPLVRNTSWLALPRLMQTSTVGGESVTEHTALAVMPQRPLGPLLVMMFTAAGSCAMALRKSICVWLRLTISAPFLSWDRRQSGP